MSVSSYHSKNSLSNCGLEDNSGRYRFAVQGTGCDTTIVYRLLFGDVDPALLRDLEAPGEGCSL